MLCRQCERIESSSSLPVLLLPCPGEFISVVEVLSTKPQSLCREAQTGSSLTEIASQRIRQVHASLSRSIFSRASALTVVKTQGSHPAEKRREFDYESTSRWLRIPTSKPLILFCLILLSKYMDSSTTDYIVRM